MIFVVYAFIFILGAIIGSFLNVVIYRYNSGTSPLTGRSQCFSCGKTLAWYELIPIVSFILQRGRCSKCNTKLSWQYPIVEIISGVTFMSVFSLGMSIVETAIVLAIFSTLLVIAVYDLRHKIIPDGLGVLFAVLALVHFFTSVNFFEAFHFPYAWTLIAGPMLFFPFWVLWAVSQGRWIGLGDGKLAIGIGFFLGATLGGSAVMLAFWIGAAYALVVMAIQRIAVTTSASKVPLSMKSEIPFGPFLIIAVFIVYFTRVNFFDGSIVLFSFI